MKIRAVSANNRRRAFEVAVAGHVLVFPYARLRRPPDADNRIVDVFVDSELGKEAFTYILADGREDSVHIDAVLEYNQDASHLHELLLYDLTVQAQQCLERSGLNKREVIRRLGTSASQFYRLLDQSNYSKSIKQMLNLLNVLDCDVELVVHHRARRDAG